MKILTALAVILVLSVGLLQAVQEGTKMTLKKGIPPIDAAAPVQTETATFALG